VHRSIRTREGQTTTWCCSSITARAGIDVLISASIDEQPTVRVDIAITSHLNSIPSIREREDAAIACCGAGEIENY